MTQFLYEEDTFFFEKDTFFFVKKTYSLVEERLFFAQNTAPSAAPTTGQFSLSKNASPRKPLA